jgi:prefoldin subunit 5
MEEKEFWERVTYVESSVKSAHHRLDRIEHLAESIHSLASEMREMRSDFSNVLARVEDIEKRPQKRYDVLVNSTITAIISALAGFLISGYIG